MTIKQTVNKENPDLEGIAFWRDNYDHLTDSIDQTSEAYTIALDWNALGLYWRNVGPHSFKIGDRIILFDHEAWDLKPPAPAVTPIEVLDVGPYGIRGVSELIAYRTLKGFRSVPLSLEPVLELQSQGVITRISDLQHRKKLSQQEWDQIVEAFKLRQEQGESEEQQKRKTS